MIFYYFLLYEIMFVEIVYTERRLTVNVTETISINYELHFLSVK